MIIGVSIDTRRKLVEDYVVSEKLDWLQILDAVENNKKVNELYGITYYPSYVFIDRNGTVARTGIWTETVHSSEWS